MHDTRFDFLQAIKQDNLGLNTYLTLSCNLLSVCIEVFLDCGNFVDRISSKLHRQRPCIQLIELEYNRFDRAFFPLAFRRKNLTKSCVTLNINRERSDKRGRAAVKRAKHFISLQKMHLSANRDMAVVLRGGHVDAC